MPRVTTTLLPDPSPGVCPDVTGECAKSPNAGLVGRRFRWVNLKRLTGFQISIVQLAPAVTPIHGRLSKGPNRACSGRNAGT
jgi:hypothetical protein